MSFYYIMSKTLLIFSVIAIGICFVNAQAVNIALNKNANQHADYDIWTAGKAVDGDVCENDANADQCCSASLDETPGTIDNFWEVNLGQTYSIGRIIVHGRSGPSGRTQLPGFLVYFVSNDLESKELVFTDPNTTYPVIEFRINPEKNASIVRIERPTGNNIITLCEVKIYKACTDGYYGDNCTDICGYCQNSQQCDKVTGMCPGECQPGWMGATCSMRKNVVFNKTATQTSTLGDQVADRAVDGCVNQTNADCCSSTLAETSAEWSVNTVSQYRVGKIMVYGLAGGSDQLSGFVLYIRNKISRAEELKYNNTGVAYGNGIFNIIIEPDVLVQELFIRRTVAEPGTSLTICEVEMFEVCPAGLYGDVCSMVCGHCVDGPDSCHGINGNCLSGCAAGWSGDTCKIQCTDGFYGENCNSACGFCLNDDVCNITDGSCPNNCKSGYQGENCNIECFNGTFGYSCNETCGNCMNDDQCDVIDGTCTTGCNPGYNGSMCTDKCVSPTFGQNCSHQCNCADDAVCNHINGTCPNGCSPGWDDVTCSIPCQNKTFGEDCENACGQCLNGDQCHLISGTCADGCATGWLEDNCTVSCDAGFYGTNCTQSCYNCADNTTCHFETGICPHGCKAGWRGQKCDTECLDGSFGEMCVTRCYCEDGEPCNKTTGECPAACFDGFTGEFCHIDLNRARNKAATQSSTKDNMTALMAVDGIFSQSAPAFTGPCSSTSDSDVTNPWWYVDMGSVGVIEYVTIYGRADVTNDLENFSLYLVNSTNVTNNTPEYTRIDEPYGDGTFNISLPEGTLAQFVYVSLPSPTSLILCEVRVFGECSDGTFGPNCQGICYCANEIPCDKQTGICPPGGCQPGWLTEQCSQPCADGRYGLNCEETCGSCKANTSCEIINGTCENGCSPGWIEDTCKSECSDGKYGQECNSNCGYCIDGEACNKQTGICTTGCAAGYHGQYCLEECTNGTYGENCAMTCGGCVNETICNITTGECDQGCADGYDEPLCGLVERQTGNDADDSDTNVTAILAGVFGAIGFILLVTVAYLLYRRNRKSSDSKKAMAYYPSATHATTISSHSTQYSGYSFNEVERLLRHAFTVEDNIKYSGRL